MNSCGVAANLKVPTSLKPAVRVSVSCTDHGNGAATVKVKASATLLAVLARAPGRGSAKRGASPTRSASPFITVLAPDRAASTQR